MSDKKRLNFKDRILIVIYVIAVIIPFGVFITLIIYSFLYYVLEMPLKREKELLTFALKKTKAFIKKTFKC